MVFILVYDIYSITELVTTESEFKFPSDKIWHETVLVRALILRNETIGSWNLLDNL